MEQRINGFEQIKGFYSWVFNNPDKIRPTHISLYVFLLNQNNRANWVEWFKCPYDLAMQGACIGNKGTYYRCLDELKKWKLIDYKKGINNYKAPVVRLIQLYESVPLTEQVTVPQSEPQTVPLTEPQTVPIYKPITNNLKLITDNKDIIEKNHILIEKYILSFKKQKPFNKIFFTDNPITPYEKFCNWIITEMKNVNSLDNQITEAQFKTLHTTFTKDDVTDILMQMENNKELSKKYTSVYLTANNWLKRKK
jgi:hypothetical protein